MAKTKAKLTLTKADPGWTPKAPPEDGCLNITGDVRSGDWHWCGEPRKIRPGGCKSPYCQVHHEKNYYVPEKKG